MPAATPVRTGQTIELPSPTTVPTTLPPVDPHATPITPGDVTGQGPVGDVIGPPNHLPTTTPTDSSAGGLPSWPEAIDAGDADVLPQVANVREAQRLLERSYPPLLRDAGVPGRTVVTLVIDRGGNVEPGSVSVQESSHDAFREAAVRAVERFHFRPARLNGQAISVIISIPFYCNFASFGCCVVIVVLWVAGFADSG
jgi:protein TonB